MTDSVYASLFQARAALAIAERLPGADATTRAGWLARLSEALPAHKYGEVGCSEEDIRTRLAGFERDAPSAFRATAAPVKPRDYFGCPDEATVKALPPDERINRVRLAEAEEKAGIRCEHGRGQGEERRRQEE